MRGVKEKRYNERNVVVLSVMSLYKGKNALDIALDTMSFVHSKEERPGIS